ncbi:MAG: DUF416 family protein [Pedobacter agri]
MAVAEISKLKEFPLPKQLTFAYLTSVRFYAISEVFATQYGYGDKSVFKEAIDFVHCSIFTYDNISVTELQDLLQKIFKNVPGTNQFPNYHGTLAMYSGGIVYESVNLLKGPDVSKVLIDISDMAINIIDCYIQERDNMDYEDEYFEEKILSDGSMQSELSIQKGIISYLTRIESIEPSDIDTLLELQNNNGRGMFNL